MLQRVTRRTWKVFRNLFIANTTAVAALAAINATSTDDDFIETQRRASSVDLAPTPSQKITSVVSSLLVAPFDISRRRRTPPVASTPTTHHQPLHQLTADETLVLQSIVSLLSFDLRPVVFEAMVVTAEITDPLIHLRGLSEVRDAWHFLSYFFRKSEPYIHLVSRAPDGRLLASVETTLVPFFYPDTWAPLTFKSTVVCHMVPTHQPGVRRLKRMEHRWHNGPIVGSPSYHGSFAAAGDAIRSWNGFLLSLMATWSAPAGTSKAAA